MTPERVKELANEVRASGMTGSLDRGLEISAILESHARMLEAGLPERIKEIERIHKLHMAISDIALEDDLFLVQHRATLLDAVRVLTAELGRAIEVIDERIAEAEKWHSMWRHAKAEAVATDVEVERLQNQVDSARAKVERLTDQIAFITAQRDGAITACEQHAIRGDTALDEVARLKTELYTAQAMQMQTEKDHDAEKERADELAKQIPPPWSAHACLNGE